MLRFLKRLFKTNELPKQNQSTNLLKYKPIETETSSPNRSATTAVKKASSSIIPINVPVVADPTKRGIDIEFKLEDDKDNVIRINQLQPEGCQKKIAEFVPVVGITKDNREKGAIKFIEGKKREVELRKEPTNPYDKNAIEVYGHCLVNDKQFTCKLGYIPKEVSRKISSVEPLKATIKLMYYPTDETSIGIRIDIWTKSATRKKVEDIPYKKMKIPADQVDRNLIGRDLEKEGYVDNAIELYELNIEEGFDGNFPYDRLAIIYRKRKQYQDEIRVLEKGIEVFESLQRFSPRQDIEPKLNKFKDRLSKALELSDK